MSFVERAPVVVSLVLLLALLAGLFGRRLHRVCYSFPVWLGAVLAGDALMFRWPDTFFTWRFFMVKEPVYAALKLAIAVEITARAFEGFPSARTTMRRVMLAVLLFSFSLLWPAGALAAFAGAYDPPRTQRVRP